MIKSYLDSLYNFWPFYVRAHSRPGTRWLHFIGNTNLFIWLFLAAVQRSLPVAVLGVMTSYTFAWIGHFLVERNVPATFRYPLKAGVCDMVMYYKMWRGEMDAEVKKYVTDTHS